MSCYPVIIVLNMALQSGHNFNSFHTSTSTFVSNFVPNKINLFGVVAWCAVFCSDGGVDVQMGRVARREAGIVCLCRGRLDFHIQFISAPLAIIEQAQDAASLSQFLPRRSPSPPKPVRLQWRAVFKITRASFMVL